MSKEIIIYHKPTCPFCVKALDLFAKKNVTVTQYDIAAQPELRDEMIEKAAGRTTVPQIFIGDIHVGGCDDLFLLEKDGELDRML